MTDYDCATEPADGHAPATVIHRGPPIYAALTARVRELEAQRDEARQAIADVLHDLRAAADRQDGFAASELAHTDADRQMYKHGARLLRLVADRLEGGGS